jgi:hypothetical protein
MCAERTRSACAAAWLLGTAGRGSEVSARFLVGREAEAASAVKAGEP